MARITKQKVTKKYTKNTYRKALRYLREDFASRCAYSLRHEDVQGQLEVDHFNPTLKSRFRNAYTNLMPAIRQCNGKKSDHWPTSADIARGIRYLNPCNEDDYNTQIFEDPLSHLLVGTTPAAKYHIRKLDLNAPFLVLERQFRANLHAIIKGGVKKYKGSFSLAGMEACDEAYQGVEEMAKLFIPPIKPPP